jgi:CDP-glycerol glycerophosphotransferase (TagB/SpsB family)
LRWNRFLSNKRLIELLEKENIDLIFYPHYEMQPYLKYFHAGSAKIKIASFANYDVQTLLKESALLITDYSSVFFDFAYMQKSCIYYQFDMEDFQKKHYKQGYFNYREMGFGPVVVTEEDLIKCVVDQLENWFIIDNKYRERCECFFPLRDKDNCSRIFQEIEKLKCN